MPARMGRSMAALAVVATALACGGTNDLESATSGDPDTMTRSRWMKNGWHTVGGTLSGLSGTVELQDNGTDFLSLSSDGSFTFPALRNGSTYDVTIRTQPNGQTCSVANGTGTISRADVTNVEVSCTTNVTAPACGDGVCNGTETCSTCPVDCGVCPPACGDVVCNGTETCSTCPADCGACPTSLYSVGGSLAGLASGNTLVLYDNGGDPVTLSADSSFTFATPLADGSVYDVTLDQPPNQLCAITNKTGTIAGADVTNVTVSCADSSSLYYFYSGYCIADPTSGKLTGQCMDLDTCAIDVSPYCCTGLLNPPTVAAYCGPVLDDTPCMF